MKPNIFKISQISPGQSVVCIVGKAEIPDILKLTKAERAYALKQLKAKRSMFSLIHIPGVLILSG